MIIVDFEKLDLDAVYNEAIGNLNCGTYSSPCIIGAMLPEEVRNELPQRTIMTALVYRGCFGFADRRALWDARSLQVAFDHGSREDFDQEWKIFYEKYA
jgi:hypothetical protein